jgi:hypothetical protein
VLTFSSPVCVHVLTFSSPVCVHVLTFSSPITREWGCWSVLVDCISPFHKFGLLVALASAWSLTVVRPFWTPAVYIGDCWRYPYYPTSFPQQLGLDPSFWILLTLMTLMRWCQWCRSLVRD